MKMLLLLLFLNLVFSAVCNDQVLILKYNRRDDCAKSLVDLPIKSAMMEFTFCGKYSFKFLRSSVLMGFDFNTFFGMNYENGMARVKIYGSISYINLTNHSLKPDQWQHLCFSASSNHVLIVMNGVLLKNETIHYTDITFGRMWIGGFLGSKFYEERRMEGAITEVHIWNETLEASYLVSITSNAVVASNIIQPPALFSWQKLKVKYNTSCIEYIMLDRNDESFDENSEKIALMDHLADFDTSNYLCQAFGGKLLVPKTDQDLIELGSLLNQSSKCSNQASWNAFVGLKKINKTSVVNIDGQISSFVKWQKTQPNGKEFEKCVKVWKDGFEYDTPCSHKYCFACQIKAKIRFTLRGNISDAIEREFFVDMTKKQTEIRGLFRTECFWKDGTWYFGKHLKLDSNMPPVGVRKWNNGNFLKFTQCNESEFTCHTYGQCIPRNKRCDGILDCPIDGSDENDCKIMTLSKGYDRKNPPAKNTTTFVSIQVFDIIDINELDMTYTVYFRVTMKWFDSRIIFRNLKARAYENNLEDSEFDKIWIPNLYIMHSNNVYMKEHQEDKGINVIVRMNRYGLPKPNELSEIDEELLYPGNENSINLLNYFHIKLGCKFDLKW